MSAARAYTGRHRSPDRPTWSAWAYKGQHWAGWGRQSTAQLVAQLAAGRLVQRALADGAATPIAAPGWPALLTPPTCGERGPATQTAAGATEGDPADGEVASLRLSASPAGAPDPVASWVGPPVTPLAPHPSDPWRVDWWDADTDATAIIGSILAAAPRHAADRLQPMQDPALAGRTEVA